MGSVLKLSGVLSQARVVSIHRKDHGTVLLGALQAVAEAGNEFSRHVTNAKLVRKLVQRMEEMKVDQANRSKRGEVDAAQPPFVPHSVHGPSLRWDDAFDGLVERMINSNDQKTKFIAFDDLVGAASYVQLHGVARATDIIPVHCRKGNEGSCA